MSPIISVMGLKEIQEETGIFEASDGALCIGLDFSDLDYLRDMKVDATVVDEPKDVKGIRGKFNVIVVAPDMSVFSVFGVVEECVDALLLNGKIVVKVKVEADFEDAKNMVAQLSKSLKLQPEEYVTTSENDVWLILSRMQR